MNLNFDFNGKTLLKNWWQIVSDNFKTVQSEFAALTSSLTTHKTAATLDHPNKSVTTDKIADKAVTTAKIADYAIGATQLAQYSISSAKIYPNAVLTSHIKDENITKAKLSSELKTTLETLASDDTNLTKRVTSLEEQAGRTVDEELSEDSKNPVASSAIYEAMKHKMPLMPSVNLPTYTYNGDGMQLNVDGSVDTEQVYYFRNVAANAHTIDTIVCASGTFLVKSFVDDDDTILKGDYVLLRFSDDIAYETDKSVYIIARSRSADTALSLYSGRPIANRVVKAEFDTIEKELSALTDRVTALEG
jgi:hypothetical protein